MNGIQNARKAVSADAAGAALGAVALIGFGWFVWKILPQLETWKTLLSATGVWLAASVVMWFVRKRHLPRRAFRAIAGAHPSSQSSPIDNESGRPATHRRD